MAPTPGLDELSRRLDALVDDGMLGGWVVAVSSQDGRASACGGSRSPGGEPMTPDVRFSQTSCSKPYAGALALRLAEQGVLRLDDPVARWLPELAEPRVLRSPTAALHDTDPAERPITVRHLLTMTPGFGWMSEAGPLASAYDDLGIAPGPWPPSMSADEYLQRLGSLPLANQPGTAWRYHQSSDALSVLLARAAGMPLEQLLDELVLVPLGLHDTGFHGDATRLATIYGPGEDGRLVPFAVQEGARTEPPRFATLSNGLVSTMHDHAAFLGSLVGAGPPLLERASVEAMLADELTPARRATAAGMLPDDSGWGLHVELRRDGRFGWAGGLGTIGYADPATHRAAALGTQTSFEAAGTALAFDAFWSLFE